MIVRIASFVLGCLLAMGTAFAQDTENAVPPEARASQESIHHLLDIMEAQKVVQTMSEQMDSFYKGIVNKMLDGKQLTPEQTQEIEQRRVKVQAMFKEMFAWPNMEQYYLKVYAETFTQAEIDGMTAFYSSPTGQAVIAKMPLAVKNSMLEIQQRMQSLMPQVQQMAKETAEQIKADDTANRKKAG